MAVLLVCTAQPNPIGHKHAHALGSVVVEAVKRAVEGGVARAVSCLQVGSSGANELQKAGLPACGVVSRTRL